MAVENPGGGDFRTEKTVGKTAPPGETSELIIKETAAKPVGRPPASVHSEETVPSCLDFGFVKHPPSTTADSPFDPKRV